MYTYLLPTRRDYYRIRYAVDESLTVAELIEYLEQLDPNQKIIFSNDNGYTYGIIDPESISDHRLTEDEEDYE